MDELLARQVPYSLEAELSLLRPMLMQWARTFTVMML